MNFMLMNLKSEVLLMNRKNACFFTLAMIAVYLSGCQTSKNCLQNIADKRAGEIFADDFESGMSKWFFSSSACTGEWALIDSTSHSGSKCLAMWNVRPTDQSEYQWWLSAKMKTSNNFTLSRDRDYYLSVWMKREGPVGYSQACVGLHKDTSIEYHTNMLSDTWQKTEILICSENGTGTYTLQIQLLMRPCKGKVFFDDVVLREATAEESERLRKPIMDTLDPASLPTTSTPVKGTARSRAHLEEINGQWWCVATDGRAEILRGIDKSSFSSSNVPDYRDWVLAHYSSMTDYYLKNMYPRLEEWGFNGITGAWDSLDLYRNGESGLFGFNLVMSTYAISKDRTANAPYELQCRDGRSISQVYGASKGVADPWNSDWKAALPGCINSWVGPQATYKENVFWQTDNEADMAYLSYFVWSDNCSTALLNYLQEKYGDINSLKTEWNAPGYATYTYNSFEDIRDINHAQGRPLPMSWEDQVTADLGAFERRIHTEYALAERTAMHSIQPDVMIATNKMMSHTAGRLTGTGMWDCFSLYDVICVQTVSNPVYKQNWDSPIGMGPSGFEILRAAHEASGRPVFISEWQVTSRENNYGGPGALATQAERGQVYAINTTQIATTPFLVGDMWFCWTDWLWGHPSTGENTGLVQAMSGPVGQIDEPYQDCVMEMKKINDRIAAIDPTCRTWGGTASAPAAVINTCVCTGQPVTMLLTGLCLGLLAWARSSRKDRPGLLR